MGMAVFSGDSPVMVPLRLRIFLLIVVFVWSTSYVAIRYSVVSFDPGSMAFIRFTVASICMLFVYFTLPKHHHLTVMEWAKVALLGLIGFSCYNFALSSGERQVPAGITSFVVSQTPIVVAILAAIFLREKITLKALVGICVTFFGTLIILYGDSKGWHFTLGFLWIVVACISLSVYLAFQKPLLKKLHPLEFVALTIWFGWLFLLPYAGSAYHEIFQAPLSHTLMIAYLGIFPGAISYVLWSYVVSRIDLSKAAPYLYLGPFMTMLIAWVILDETPTYTTFGGGMVMILGAYLVNRSRESLLQTISKKFPRRKYLLSGSAKKAKLFVF